MERKHATTAAVCLVPLPGGGAAGGHDDSASTGANGSNGSDTTEPDTSEPVIDPGDGGNYHPDIDPANFVDVVDNPYMPWMPGARWVYEGQSEGDTERTEVTVTDEQREVMGISVTVVRDTVYVNDELAEDTYDWYAQDRDGNVWYMGEDTKEYENGEVTSTEGSWEAGVDGALPGIVMPADPQVGDAYRQEYYPDHAEDLVEIEELGTTRSVQLGDYQDVLVTKEWNPLEPDVIENKFYASGVGNIGEQAVAGSDEVSELVEYTSGG
jgi:hypothetical protein